MKKALKEYDEMVVKPGFRWLAKHWKGYTVLMVIIVAVEMTWIFRSEVKDFIDDKILSKFIKNEEES